MIVKTRDTNEEVEVPEAPSSYDADGYSLDGYDWMVAAESQGWRAAPSADGRLLGDWPYVVYVRREFYDHQGRLSGWARYVEGDVMARWYRDPAKRESALITLAGSADE